MLGLCLARVRNVIHTPLAFRFIPFLRGFHFVLDERRTDEQNENDDQAKTTATCSFQQWLPRTSLSLSHVQQKGLYVISLQEQWEKERAYRRHFYISGTRGSVMAGSCK